MSTLLGIGLLVALLCLSGIIFAVSQVHRLIDASRVHPRTRAERSVDDDGLFSQLTREQAEILHIEQDRLDHSSVKNARLRTDLPPLAREEEKGARYV